MAQHNQVPTLDLSAGEQVLDEDLPRVLAQLDAGDLEQLGWRRVDGRTLIVPVQGSRDGKIDDFCLRLEFKTGRDWPPSAQFVNPETLDYEYPADVSHLPVLTSSEAQVHTRYQPSSGPPIQLICCSATLEYYQVLHGGEEMHLWTTQDNFLVTITAIRRAMGQHYGGRHKHDG